MYALLIVNQHLPPEQSEDLFFTGGEKQIQWQRRKDEQHLVKTAPQDFLRFS
jgi:hypothetical protein